ncbi:alpha/beta hydrolase [Microbacterium sp. 1P10UB]|uniref:alpha/beta fold hydrolase n=1 Tax=unclassified Microbacterium TaxID=2609290 RepID=UPI0039A0D3B1
MRGLPLVLLAGMNCTADLWTGCGLDDALTPVLDRPTMDEQVAHLSDTLPERFVLGGLSLGAIVAMELAVRAPERVAGLCLVSTNAKAPTDAQQAGWREWRQRLDDGATAEELQRSILPALLSAEGLARPDLVTRALAMGEETGERMLRAQLLLQSTRRDLLARLPSVAVPALVVSGTADAICLPTFHTEIAAELPGARVVAVDAGHLLPLERPGEVGALVSAFRARLG